MSILIEKELGAIPSTAEIEVVDILVIHNVVKKRVTFLKPSRAKGSKTPDLLIDDAYWEIKSLDKLGKYTLEHTLRAGLKQADNLVLDLRNLSIGLEKKARREIEREYRKRKGWRGLIIIVRFDGECLTFHK